MNQVIETIKRRRSVRSYKEEQVADEQLKAILEAGIYAPSGNNSQSWFFSVLQNKALLEKVNSWIIAEAKHSSHPKAQELASTLNAAVFRFAPTVIIVSGDPRDMLAKENCATAGQNIMLAAESLGIGSCWIWYASLLAESPSLGKYREELKIPDSYSPFFALTLGYSSAQNQAAPPRRRNVVALFR